MKSWGSGCKGYDRRGFAWHSWYPGLQPNTTNHNKNWAAIIDHVPTRPSPCRSGWSPSTLLAPLGVYLGIPKPHSLHPFWTAQKSGRNDWAFCHGVIMFLHPILLLFHALSGCSKGIPVNVLHLNLSPSTSWGSLPNPMMNQEIVSQEKKRQGMAPYY